MATTTVLNPHPVAYPSVAVRYLCRSWWSCYSTPRHTWRVRCDSLLATEQALSVVSPTTRASLDLVVTPVPGWRGQVPPWFGIPCRIGRVTLWLPVEDGPDLYRDLSLLVLLPREDLEDAPPFIYLGTQFLLEHRAQVFLDCSSATNQGRLIIP
jgi:hypothetical protein